MEQSQKILKAVSLYLLYFLYSKIAAYFAQTITLMNGKAIYLIFDIFFLAFVCFLYFQNLKKDYKTLKKEYNWKKIFLTIVIYILGTLFVNLIIVFLGEIFFKTGMDANTESIQDLAKISPVYAVFKTMIFGVIAEEILYRESLSEVINNNTIFIFVTSFIYAILPFVFNVSSVSLMSLLIYFLPSLLISYLYVKNDRNIIIVMIMKFVYNLIPLAILIGDLIQG